MEKKNERQDLKVRDIQVDIQLERKKEETINLPSPSIHLIKGVQIRPVSTLCVCVLSSLTGEGKR